MIRNCLQPERTMPSPGEVCNKSHDVGFDNATGCNFDFLVQVARWPRCSPGVCVGQGCLPGRAWALSSSPRQLEGDQQFPSHPGSLSQHVVLLHGVTNWGSRFPVVTAQWPRTQFGICIWAWTTGKSSPSQASLSTSVRWEWPGPSSNIMVSCTNVCECLTKCQAYRKCSSQKEKKIV